MRIYTYVSCIDFPDQTFVSVLYILLYLALSACLSMKEMKHFFFLFPFIKGFCSKHVESYEMVLVAMMVFMKCLCTVIGLLWHLKRLGIPSNQE